MSEPIRHGATRSGPCKRNAVGDLLSAFGNALSPGGAGNETSERMR